MEFHSDESISCGVSWTNFMVQASLYCQEKVMFLLLPNLFRINACPDTVYRCIIA